ncbi:MAG: VCBS repeat-containing protein [Thermoguttaceae bacterium]|nr:VCBS repeat-containing protein [Thermoguttaceae bacterium]MDW8039547.1 VCBS repeat-containing protein [Thermoguttaceae bacterium]
MIRQAILIGSFLGGSTWRMGNCRLLLLPMVLLGNWGAAGTLAMAAEAGRPTWTYLSSALGNLPPPNTGTQQTACLVLDIDKDKIDDFVIAERTQSPSVVWYKYQGNRRWAKYVVELEPLHIEAGGDFCDIDADGDLDIVFTGDWQSDGVWWWENPYPQYLPDKPWKRRTIKSGDGARHQHDCRFGDFDGNGRKELVWWSQSAKKLFLAPIPDNPREAKSWSYVPIFSYTGSLGHEGLDVADIDLDSKQDIVGAGYWFQHRQGHEFTAHKISDRPFTRTAVGQLVPGGRPEVVISPGESVGPVDWYQWDGQGWVPRRLLDKVHNGHSLQIQDIDRDGHLDIFVAEMGKPGAGPNCKMWIFWGNGKAQFTQQLISVGKDNHESKLGDLDGNGKLDILGKPYSFQTPMLHIWLQE